MKMKKIYTVFALSLGMVALAQAQNKRPSPKAFERPYGMAGCGLGSLVFKENDNSQILAATTNGTSGSQTFGITTGTSNCVSGPNVAVAEKLDQFLAANSAQVAEDLSRGQGEALNTVTGILGCANDAVVNAELKNHFSEIFVRHDVKVNEVSDSFVSVVKENTQLKSACSAVI